MKRAIIFSVIILLILFGVIFFITQQNSSDSKTENEQNINSERNEEVIEEERQIIREDRDANDNCEGTKIKFDYSPVNLEKTSVFLPLGLMTGSHVTPIDHHYFQNFNNNKPDIEVYSPGDGYITDIQHMPNAKAGEDYRLVIQHTCTISSIYIHIYFLSDNLKQAIGDKDYLSAKIPVKAGELIGYYEKNVDYNLVDEEVTLNGFIVPEHYRAEPWKIHVPNTYEYFNEPIRSKLIEKSLRTTEPISGKIDYDIDGKLVGNWFLEGSDGYSGDYTNNERYWLGHLSIVYDAYDTDTIILSIANYEGEDSRQYAVKGNSPDPASIGVDSGLIKYELVRYNYFTSEGKLWDSKTLAKGIRIESNGMVDGVVLAQLIENRRLKFEVFHGKVGSQVNGFSDKAKIYER